jgi:hypothetical protein
MVVCVPLLFAAPPPPPGSLPAGHYKMQYDGEPPNSWRPFDVVADPTWPPAVITGWPTVEPPSINYDGKMVYENGYYIGEEAGDPENHWVRVWFTPDDPAHPENGGRFTEIHYDRDGPIAGPFHGTYGPR